MAASVLNAEFNATGKITRLRFFNSPPGAAVTLIGNPWSQLRNTSSARSVMSTLIERKLDRRDHGGEARRSTVSLGQHHATEARLRAGIVQEAVRAWWIQVFFVSGAAPNLSTCASRSRAHFSASSLVSKLLRRSLIPCLRTCACQRPLSFRIVATVTSNVHCRSCVGCPPRGVQGLSRRSNYTH